MFRKYMHLERLGNEEVEGITNNQIYVFPKLDGTSGGLFYDTKSNEIKGHSRKRLLTLDNDNQGFINICHSDQRYHDFFNKYYGMQLYGEFLVPHTIKDYEDSAWKKFYVYDVFDLENDKYLHYEEYKPIIEAHDIDYIPVQCIMHNATEEALYKELQNANYLVKDGFKGEGIVIKAYEFTNKYGNRVWAKLVSNEFKSNASKKQPIVKNFADCVELKIVNEYVTYHFVDKVYQKINNSEGWSSKKIPMLFGVVYYDLINEELWNILKKYKNPVIDFTRLNQMIITKIKSLKEELF